MNKRLLVSASILFLTAGLFLASCKSNKSESASGSAANSAAMTGAGSTFVYPIMTRWISGFQQTNASAQINYQSIGSGGGIQQLKKGLVDFGASDAALSDEQLKEMPPLVQIPESAGPVCITYNLPGLTQPLKLSGEALAGIYLGTIKTWQDPLIKKANPGVNLPGTAVAVVHRSDGSGTTNIFTTYLSSVSSDWKSKAGQWLSINWPVGLGGKGSEGVTGVVKQTPGAIGYVELSYAAENRLPVADLQNKAGKWVAPSAESSTAAIAAFASELAKDVRTPIVNPPASAAEAYPISGLTYLLVPKSPANAAKAAQVKSFVQYIITTGQDIAPQLHYAKLPQQLIETDQNLLSQIAGGK